MIVLVLTALGVGSALFTRDRVRRFAELRLVGLWLVWLAIITQVLIFEVVGYFIPVWIVDVLHLGTYALCIAFMYRNRHLPGGWIIMLGTAANLAAITANGGTMPASATAWEKAGLREPTEFENSSTATDGNLAVLGDIFYIPEGWPLANVFSIGDVLIVVGGAYLAHVWCARPARVDGAVGEDVDIESDLPADLDAATLGDAELPVDAWVAVDAERPEPIPADLDRLAMAVNELRDTLRVRLDAVAADAAASRRESASLYHEARHDVVQTRDTLIGLIAEIEGNVASPQNNSSSPDTARIDRLERQLASQHEALQRSNDRQRELAEMLAAALNASSAQV